jgi:aminoglycoside 2''-phosphotransferase
LVQPDWPAIERENPGLAIRTTRLLGEGWNSRAWLVNDDLIVRCPKHPDHWEELEREIAFLDFAADRLPLRVPRYSRVARYSSASPNGYAAYKFLPGGPLDLATVSDVQQDAAAAALAAFLQTLHALRPGPESGVTLPRDDERVAAETFRIHAAREIVPRLAPRAADALMNLFEMHLGTAANFSFEPVVGHADFSPDHIVMTDGVITGVIDFGDVSWVDPDYDFMYLFLSCGLSFTESVARRYGHLDPPRLRRKLLYFAVVDQIDTIVNGEGHASEDQRRSAWLTMDRLLTNVR